VIIAFISSKVPPKPSESEVVIAKGRQGFVYCSRQIKGKKVLV